MGSLRRGGMNSTTNQTTVEAGIPLAILWICPGTEMT